MTLSRPLLLSTVAVGVVALMLASMAVSLGVGAVRVPLDSVVGVVLRRMHLGDFGVTVVADQIVWQLRMPRVLGAAAVGGGLAVCGAVLQSLTRNDLADPYLLGISSGASAGVVTVMVLGVSVAGLVGSAAVTAAGFLGALAALVLVLGLATGPRGALSPTRTVLAGVIVAQLCGAYVSVVVLMSGDQDAARRVLSWTLGSLAGMRWESAVLVAAVAVAGTAVAVAVAGQLDAFAFGEVAARSLGVRVERLRWLLLVVTALMTACLVAYAGAIGFVGLVVPHLVRGVTGPAHRVLLPLCALVGATLLVWSDTVARSLVESQEIPVGVVTAAIGAPFFCWMLFRMRGRA
ncbi:iron chelate uptake ABC transporter family permease subunit [Nocardioides rotundus]|uniref:FecCD family ABC transporter permease n=1 Tax=Nocardioides rotundus TaxID=1774216 RepID=UPI001CBDDF19|nr:iron chelate uptake ABC transporter family permease subunit [Nocardioides rotundus]UAL31560.1 iron chelate uptake ABC transporter family permease subunit [Nocardioides rotundus]